MADDQTTPPKPLVFDYCAEDAEGGCVGCAGDGQGDCRAVMREAPANG